MRRIVVENLSKDITTHAFGDCVAWAEQQGHFLLVL